MSRRAAVSVTCRDASPRAGTVVVVSLDDLLATARAQRAGAGAVAPSGLVPEDLLTSALTALEHARTAHEAGDPQAELRHLEPLAHQISDSWPYASELGAEILGHVQGLRGRLIRLG